MSNAIFSFISLITYEKIDLILEIDIAGYNWPIGPWKMYGFKNTVFKHNLLLFDHIGWSNGLVLIRLQAMNWTSVDQFQWCHYGVIKP